jgi:hypothetical protein
MRCAIWFRRSSAAKKCCKYSVELFSQNETIVCFVASCLKGFLVMEVNTGLHCNCRTLTLRYSIPVMIPTMKSELATMFGRAKGYLARNLLPPKSAGQFSVGFAKKPPKDGPNIDPIDQTKGIMEKARGPN